MKILLIDPISPLAYTPAQLKLGRIGGMESTLMRLASELGKKHQVYIAQPKREQSECIDNVHYINLETAYQLQAVDVLIIVRHCPDPLFYKKQFPSARKLLWLHNLPSKRLFYSQQALQEAGFEVIGVSDFHCRKIKRRINGTGFQYLYKLSGKYRTNIPVTRIYNSIAGDLAPDDTVRDPNKLLFLSSPQKGLQETHAIFQRIRKIFPDFKLYVANPGHRLLEHSFGDHVVNLGVLPHADVIKQLREAFCVFYPQWTVAETFGLIYAEANAVGTPVLAHNHGAAAEVLSDASQLVNGHNDEQIISTLQAWQREYPQLCGKSVFSPEAVAEEWLSYLENEHACAS